jgi:hypothetical protein
MPRTGFLVVGLLGAAACLMENKSSPLGDLADVTRIEVSKAGEPPHAFGLPADSFRIAMVVEAVRAHDSEWRKSWHTLPAGELTVHFMRDSALLGVLWLGPEFLVARGAGEPLLTSIGRVEETHLRALFNPTTVIGTISNQPPAPQN